MIKEHHLGSKRFRSISLVLIMLLSTVAVIDFAGASVSRQYTTHYNPTDIAIADFDCDGHKDLAIATDFSHRMTVLWNDGTGDFSERTDIWISNADPDDADWTDIAFADKVEIKNNADGPADIVIWQANLPFNQPPQPGNITILNNDGCNTRTFTIGERFTHFYVFDVKVGDFDVDGNDDIAVLELASDLSSQNIIVYPGPNPLLFDRELTALGQSSTFTFTEFYIGDKGEPLSVDPVTGQTNPADCVDNDIWLIRGYGVDYSQGQLTNAGSSDNVTVVEYDCTLGNQGTNGQGRFPADATTQQNGVSTNNPVEVTLNTDYGGFAIADIDEDGVIDTVAMTDENSENISYVTRSGTGAWSSVQKQFFGPHVAFSLAISELNNDNKPDFIIPTLLEGFEYTSSSGQQGTEYYFDTISTVQVVLSKSNGYKDPLSYDVGTRASFATVDQFVGTSNSAPDIVVGYADYAWGNPYYWAESRGWNGQYDHITVIEMDYKDLAIEDIDIGPTDAYYGIVGEGNRDVNITLLNGGMEELSGTFNLGVKIDEINTSLSTNSTVYANNFDGSEESVGCGGGCTWTNEQYLESESMNWHIETETITGSSDDGEEPNNNSYQANWEGNNPTDFYWVGSTLENSSGTSWTGYEANWDEAVVLNDIDLTGADRAWLSLDLFGSYDYSGLGNAGNGFFALYWVYDDTGFIEIKKDDSGWQPISCPFMAILDDYCPATVAQWGGFDNDRVLNQIINGDAERFSPGTASGVYGGTHYGWQSYTAEGLGEFDLSNWAGDVVDIRFRFRSGYQGSIGYENETFWSGLDGFAFDNLSITKQQTSFSNIYDDNQPVTVSNLEPGETINEKVQFDFQNEKTYRISAEISPDASWINEQEINNELKYFIETRNLFDPAVVDVEFFEDGGLYAEGELPMKATVTNYGNTEMDFDVEATILYASATVLKCGPTDSECRETFENPQRYVHIDDDNDGQGDIIDDSEIEDKRIGSSAWWFGHPDVLETGQSGYGDDWDENMSITDIDLSGLAGSYAALTFEYFADTHYYISSNGSFYNYEDTVQLFIEWEKDVDGDGSIGVDERFSGIIYGQYNDYNNDNYCSSDEIEYLGDVVDPNNGRESQFLFNSGGEVKSTSVDFTHIYLLNTSVSIGGYYYTECTSLSGASDVDLTFHFESNADGYNGQNNGYLGVAIDNISVKEYTFVPDMTYTETVTGVDAQEEVEIDFGMHDFDPGVYRFEVTTIFDNTTPSTSWFGEEEIVAIENNRTRATFNIENVQLTILPPNYLKCVEDSYKCIYPIDEVANHEFSAQVQNGVLAGNYVFNLEVIETDTNQMVFNQSTTTAYELKPGEVETIEFPIFIGWESGKEYRVGFKSYLVGGGVSGNDPNFTATFSNQIDILILSNSISGHLPNVIQTLENDSMTYTQFTMSRDWDTYLNNNWLSTSVNGANGYEKILLPYQTDETAQLFAEKINEEKSTFEGFMNSGGTIEMHLGPYQQYYQSTTGGRLPLGITVSNRADIDNTSSKHFVQYSDVVIGEKFHPILDGFNVSDMENWKENVGNSKISYVADSVLNTQSLIDQDTTMRGALSTVPLGNCRDSLVGDGTFQNVIKHRTENRFNSLLAICNIGDGGLIATTIDVETKSNKLLSNMLNYQVTEYSNFGSFGESFGLKVDGYEPCGRLNIQVCQDQGYDFSQISQERDYEIYYIKSNTQLELSYFSNLQGLNANWVIEGPTDWNNDLYPDEANKNPSLVINSGSVTPLLCEPTISVTYECNQGATWNISLYLYDNEGHGRKLFIQIVTDDVNADTEKPIAEFNIDWSNEDDEKTNSAEVITHPEFPTKDFRGVPRDVYQIILPDDIDSNYKSETGVRVYFDAGLSKDLDWVGQGTGITYYEWRIVNDYPLKYSQFKDIRVYGEIESPDDPNNNRASPYFNYQFFNVTKDKDTSFEDSLIWFDLIVYDNAMNPSQTSRIYFQVVSPDLVDEPPTWEYEDSISCGVQKNNPCTLDETENSDEFLEFTVSITGGVESQGVYIEVSTMDPKTLVTADKAKMQTAGTYAASSENQIGSKSNFRLNITNSYGDIDTSNTITIYIRVTEGQSYDLSESFTISLVNNLIDESDEDESINEGTNSNTDTQSSNTANSLILFGGIGVFIIMTLILTLLFVRRRGDSDEGSFGGNFHEIDEVEVYVQQLVAQGYPEETARSYAQAQFSQRQAATAGVATPNLQSASVQSSAQATNPKMEAYIQQLISQGYPESQARAYAMQFADRFK
ncbi:MAG: hypothetical protein CMB56_005490 [Methanobacteriota archaeon]|nr:MAG: hypothetical protein CMB56_005490 [Euryarchaeota archaeon]|tara:strand:+ start:53 stop:6838 length:6786 start_codon:yes stop_codon:yes gene_type:complete